MTWEWLALIRFMLFFCFLVLGGFALYVMTPTERGRLLGRALHGVRFAKDAAVQVHAASDPFHDALRERTPWPIVTPAIVILNIVVFLRMLFGEGSFSDPQTLVDWGGSYAPRTTNGEWWRLVTTTFVHVGPVHLLADMAGLVVIGIMLERLIGPFAFATLYFAAGVFASLANLSADPMIVRVGASGAIFGLYGLLLASTIWGVFRRSLAIPLLAVKKLAPGAGFFLLYSAATGNLGAMALNGFVMGFVCGLVLAWGVSERKTPALRSAAAMAATLAIAIAAAVPLRGFTDVKPEIERVLAVEPKTAKAYEAAVAQFRLGGINAEALAQVIDRSILPELQAARARLQALDRIPAEHQSMVTKADEYLRLRSDSWRLRADGLLKHNLPTIQRADRTERASLDVFDAIKTTEQK